MQLHVSPSMRRLTISSNNGFIDLTKIKVAARHISYRTLFHTFLIPAFLLPFVFILTALVTLEGVNKCSSFGRRLGPRLLGRDDSGQRLVKEFYKILNQVNTEEIPDGIKLPDSFNQLVPEMKNNQYDVKTFAFMLRAMVQESKFSELMNKHFAASSILRSLYCLSLRLTDEYSLNAHACSQLPSPELLPVLSNNSYHHFVLSTDDIFAASVVVTSAVQSSLKPEKIVFHILTDKKMYVGMHAWFALNPVSPAIVEVKGVQQFDWLTRENVPVLEAVENHHGIINYYHGNHIAGANLSDTTPRRFASKLQARSPKYISLLNHLWIYLPELFLNLHKVVFLDDDVVQRDLHLFGRLIYGERLMELLKLVKARMSG
ncbi:putative galacturonosyltransferase 13 [Hibiscus syriacus]|uniref:Hexosyltransferase n=1 Tax=Hibiscus syriacus TaxID=106335 RepID=A0A6A2WEJ4_HIBSY|nr:putative galacturonosyltransferase 13 [Hibiscus syriacus]